jgi:hypothetical protein
MKCSEQVKLAGLKSLRQFSEITGVPKQTLTDWYNDVEGRPNHKSRKKAFMMLLDSAVREQK